ncbi:MAG TPA: hypothetical protein VLH58_04640 [Candidatus Methylomirabilis sp.]|nr:hypothetical protein [Candidatus Methylomirabilis sp.]HSC70616.1 hypothetical protein [Candidatus Methylomirabilis sp.]
MTLLELTITLTLISLLALIVLQAFRIGSRSWEKGEQRAEVEQRIRVLSGILAQRLASIHAAMAKVDGKAVLAFQGRPDRIFFYSAPDGQGPLPQSAMVRGQAFFVRAGEGLVVQESYPLVEGEVFLESRGRLTVLEPRVTRITFRYLSPPPPGETAPRWVEAWDPRDASSESQASGGVQAQRPGAPGAAGSAAPLPEGRLPLAVGMTLTVQEERAEREIGLLLPIRVGRSL